MQQEVYTGIIVAIIIAVIIVISAIKKIKWLIVLSAIVFLFISIRTGIFWLALGYEEPPNIEIPETIEMPDIDVELPPLPTVEYVIDNSRIGFGLDGILDE